MTEIFVPIKGLRNASYKIRNRQGLDWPYVPASVAFQQKNGGASDARVVLGHVAPVPWPAATAARTLNGAKVDAAVAAKCGEAATAGAEPPSGNGFKRQPVKTAPKSPVMAAGGGLKMFFRPVKILHGPQTLPSSYIAAPPL